MIELTNHRNEEIDLGDAIPQYLCVYKLQAPDGRIYIGSTTNLKKRIIAWKSVAKNPKAKLPNKIQRVIKLYGWEGFRLFVLERYKKPGHITKEDKIFIKYREEFHIKKFWDSKILNTYKSSLGPNPGALHPRCKGQVTLTNDETGEVRTFSHQREAADSLGLDQGNLSRALKIGNRAVSGWRTPKVEEKS